MAHGWTRDELLDLLRAADATDDCWGYCGRCGMEISPLEPDATQAWCPMCREVVEVQNLAGARLV